MIDLQSAIDNAQRVAFLTGAGVSTASGIPDYRSRGGLYQDGGVSPEYALSHDNLVQHHEAFHQWVLANMFHPEAKPNVIHEKMAAISNAKGAIVTQNVDGLDRAAGAKHVIEFHGNLYDLYCQKCHAKFTYGQYQASDIHEADGGVIRPNIVLYGEPIAADVAEAAVDAVASADLIVVVGTSLVVYPFAGLLQYAKPRARILAVNREALDLPAGAAMVLGDAAELFAAVHI